MMLRTALRRISIAQPIPLAGAVAVALMFTILAWLGMEFTRHGGRIAALWLPNAVLTAILLRTRKEVAVPYLLACLGADAALNGFMGDPLPRALAVATANMAEALIATTIVRRRCGEQPDMALAPALGWLSVACVAAPAVSGLIAAAVLPPYGLDAWFPWVAADALSLALITPLIIIGTDAWRQRAAPTLREAGEWVAILAGAAGATTLIFAQTRYPLLFLACPVVIFAAFRTGVKGTAAAVAVISAIASIATAAGSGPVALVREGAAAQLLVLQLFLGTCFVMGLPVAAVLASRKEALRALAESRDSKSAILDNVGEVIFRTDAAGRWVFLNSAWERLTGYPVEESLGWPTTRLLHPDDLDDAQQLYPAIASGEVGECVLQQRFTTRAGECRHIEVALRRLTDAAGAFEGVAGNIRDVSERVLQDQALRASEERFRRLAEAAPVGIFRADRVGRLSYVNESLCDKLGLNVEGMLGQGWRDALVGDWAEGNGAWVTPHRPGEGGHRTGRFRTGNGGERLLELVSSAELDANGRVQGYVGVVVDVTEQRRATEKLVESERRFQTLAALSPAGIFRTDADGHPTYVNPAWLRLAGLGDSAWQDDRWVEAIHPDDRARVTDEWLPAVCDRTPYRGEFRYRHADGAVVWADALSRPEYDERGVLTGFIGVVMDITESKRAQDELAERTGQLRLLAENATDAVFRLALDGTCLYASPSARELLGVDAAALVGLNMLARFHPDDAPGVLDTVAALAGGEIERRIVAYRSERITAPGEYVWLEANCGLVRDPVTGAPGEIIASIRDISTTKALEAELHLARERAEAAAAAKLSFLANMSHEIRTPMNGVIGFTELLLASELPEEQRRHVQLIADSGRAMMRLLNDTLDMSKIESGEMRVVEEPVDLRDILRTSARLMEPIALGKQVDFSIEVDAAVPARIVSDPMRLGQIMLNLVGNAVKFTDEGAVEVRASISNAGAAPHLLIQVQDTGIGIARDQLDLVFQQFAQADSSIARRFGGSGLGLSISAELARLMGGSITAASTLGAGTTFTLRLPLRDAGPAPAPAPRDDAAPFFVFERAPRVLIAEDHDINQVLILSMARKTGVDATIAANGEEAIAAVETAAAQGRPFELVLMDVQMPGMDGLEATRMLRTRGFTADRLPIVALTANAYADDVATCLAAGMQAHLAKPLRLRDLVATLARFVPAIPLQPAEPPVEDSLEQRYRARKHDTLEAVAKAVRQGGCDGAELAEIASLLHKMAGTAGYFAEAELGTAMGRLEAALVAADAGARLDVLARAEEQLRRAA